jgi:hypothetical protein
MTDGDDEGDGLECLLDKAFEQDNGLMSTLGTKIINKIKQLKVDSYPDPNFKTASDSSAYRYFLILGLKLRNLHQDNSIN